MTVTKDDALSALHEIESAKRRSQTLFGYGLTSPYMLLWGVLWIVAGAGGAVSVANAGIVWGVVDIVGLLGTAWLIVRHARRCSKRDDRVRLIRYVGTAAVIAAFLGLTLMIFGPVTGLEILMLFTLLVAAGYAIAGCWAGRRYAVIGAALAGLAVGVYVVAPSQLHLIVPFAGGAALICGGLWMRRA